MGLHLVFNWNLVQINRETVQRTLIQWCHFSVQCGELREDSKEHWSKIALCLCSDHVK